MNTQTRMLMWREWRERRGQFLVCLLWMLCGTIYVIAYAATRQFRAPVASFHSTACLFGLFMPIFLAMRTSLGELTDRTRAFSNSLPVSTRRQGWLRLAGGAAVLIVPIVLSALLLSPCLATGWLEQAPARMPRDAVYVALPDRPSLDAAAALGLLWRIAAIVVCSATELYLLLALLGTRLRAEPHAGFIGAALAIVWFLGTGLSEIFDADGSRVLADWIGVLAPQGMILNHSYGHERGMYGDIYVSRAVFGPLLVNAVIQLALAALFVQLYAKKLPGRQPLRKAKAAVWWRWTLPLPTRGLALVWLALRQAVPMCLPGLAIACLLTLLGDVSDYGYIDDLPSAMWIIGTLWAVVVGAGTFSAEIDARIGEFWRTLPIPPGRLFAVKFVVGLLAVLLVLDGSVIAATWWSPHWGDYYSMNWPYIACFLPLHATMFALAVAWTCLLRRAVLGGMAAMVSFAMLNLVLEWSPATRDYGPIEVYNNLHELGSEDLVRAPIDFTAHGYPLVATVMGLVMLASIVLGWRALRRYQPRLQ